MTPIKRRNRAKLATKRQNRRIKELYDRKLQRHIQLGAIICGIASRLINVASGKLNPYIHEALGQIGQHIGVDRVNVYTCQGDPLVMTPTHEWCANGVDSVVSQLSDLTEQRFPWWFQQMHQQQVICLTSLNALPAGAAPEKEVLMDLGVQSLLIVPMFLDNCLVGTISFGVGSHTRNWDQQEVDLLITLASLLATATNRLPREQLLLRANERLEGLNRISKALLNSHLRDEQPDRTALQHLYEMIPCEVGVVFRIDDTEQFAFTESRIRKGQYEPWPGITIPTQYLHNPQLEAGQEILINHLQANEPIFPPAFNPYLWGHRSVLAIPLLAHEQYVGIVILVDPSPDFFTREHTLIGREVASQLSILLYQEAIHQQLRKQASQLTESNQLLQAVIDTSPTGLALVQPVHRAGHIVDFRYLLSNPKNARITGLSQEAMQGETLMDLFPHVKENGLFDHMIAVAQTGKSHHMQLLDHLPTGAFWGDYALIRVGDNVLFTVNDITHLKRIEEEIRQTNLDLEKRVAERTLQIQQLSALQRAILQYAGLAIAAIDTQGIIQLVNPALEVLTGYTKDELVGKLSPAALREPVSLQQGIDQLKPGLNNPILKDEEVVRAFIASHDFLRRENTLLTKDGQSVPVLSTVSGLYDDAEKLIGYVDIVTDISPLKAIERDLRQANQRTQLATKAGKLGVWEWNLLTNELVLDEQIFTLFHKVKSSACNRIADFESLVHQNDLGNLQEHARKAIRTQTPLEIDFRIVLPYDQTIRHLRANGLTLQNELGQVNRMIGVIRDRTASIESNRALLDSEQRYKSLVNRLKLVVFQIDVTGYWTYLNPAWETITGFSINESLGKRFLEFIHPDDRQPTLPLFDQLLTHQLTHVEHAIRYLHKSGGYRWVEVFAQVILNEQQEITGITGTLTDITDRKKAQQALYDSEQRFREIAENVDEIFWVRDFSEPKFLYVNPAFERYCGLSAQNVYDAPFSFLDFILEEDRAVIRASFLKKNPDQQLQFRFRHQDGSIRWLSARIFGIKNEDGILVRRIGVATDITTAIEKACILEESLEKERNLNMLKSQFITTASHEFRTPLTTISSSVELVQRYLAFNPVGPTTTAIQQHLDKIFRTVFALNDLISNTLTLSKIDEGKVNLNLEVVDLACLCKDIVKSYFSDRSDQRSVTLQVQGQPVGVRLDKRLMDHVLTNLLSNAFKFSSQNPILTISHSQHAVAITVSDKGIGIPKKDIPHLFDKFFRASNANQFKGTGLGLAICREYVTLQKGHISIDSTEGIGTTFTVTFPLC